MPQRTSHPASYVIVITLGLLLVGLGVTTMLHPEIMMRYGIAASDAHAKTTIMSVIGGGEMGLGMFLLFGRRLGVAVSAQLLSMIFLFAGLLCARTLSVFYFWPDLPSVFFREVLIEFVIVSLLGAGLYLSQRTNA